jgi:iron complex transport system ATP-binding protein
MTALNKNIILLDSLRIGYSSGKKITEIIQPVKASSRGSELIAVIGRNGIGKSTLLRTLTGLQEALGGRILLHDKNLSEYSRMDLARRVGYISTEIVRASNMTVFDLVSLGRYPHTNWLGKIDSESYLAIESSLQKTGLNDFRNRNISELSDGERQKAMIARVLAQNTEIMIMDEPTAFLDISSKYEIINLMLELTAEGKTIVFSTHDFDIALNQTDKIWLMLNSGILEGAPEDLVLDGSFDHLFDSEIIGFNSNDGSFTFTKKPRKEICISGEGIIRKWTEHALERAGYSITDNDKDLRIIIPENKNRKWVLIKKESTGHFNSIYELIQRLRD